MSEVSACVFLQEFYSIWTYIQVFNPFFSLFFYMMLVQPFSFFPTPPIQETVFSALYFLASFVIDQLAIDVCVYLQTFYPVPWVCPSGFCATPLPFKASVGCLYFFFLGDGLNSCLLYNIMNLHPQFIRHSVYQIQSLKSISHFHCII